MLNNTKYLLLIILFFTVANLAQENKITGEQDSVSVSHELNFASFNETELYYLYRYSIRELTDFNNFTIEPGLSSGTNPYIHILSANTSKDFLQSKHDLQRVLDNQYKLIQSRSLGTFGRIIATAVTATAAGIATYHVIKYKEAYGIK
ncbi:MAG: hypothetical protein PVH88_16145 [Ignavibacteria bacterium]|jgi:hypothetical protein